MGAERNISLDYLKVAMSLLVVAIHYPLLGEVSPLAEFLICECIARIAVPTFLIINGYYFYDALNGGPGAWTRWLRRVLVLYTVWMVVYLPLYYQGISSVRDVVYLGWKYVSGVGPLWYLLGMLAGGMFLVAARKLLDRRGWMLPLAVALFYLLCVYLTRFTPYLKLTTHGFNGYAPRFLIFGPPFMLAGYWLRSRGGEFVRAVCRRPALWGCVALATMLAEGVAYYFSPIEQALPDCYFSTLLAAPVVFVIFNDAVRRPSQERFFGLLASSVFFLHTYVGILVLALLPGERPTAIYLTVLFVTLLASVALVELNKKIKIFL